MNKINIKKYKFNIVFSILTFSFIGFIIIFPCKAEAAPEVTVYNIITNDTTPDIKGTISGVTGSAEVSVVIVEPIEYSLDSVTDGDWSITITDAFDSGYYYTAEVTATDGTGEDTASAFIYVDEDFPYEFYYTSEGEEAEFSSITYSEEFSYDSPDGYFSLLFPAGTVVTKTGGGTFDIAEWYAEIVDSNNERVILKLRFGVPDIDLTFSNNVTITFNVGTEYNGQTLNIFSRSDGGDDGWEPMGVDCNVVGGSCSFDTDHASYFAVTEYNSIAETEEGENDDEDDETEKAHIDSWKAYQYEDANKSCSSRLKLIIKGKHFDKDAEVKIGNHKASSVDKKSSKEIVAKFCMDKLLKNETGKKKIIKVTNPDADTEEADKKINLANVGYYMSVEDFNTQTTEGIRNIQTALVQLGFLDPQYITGIYGPITTEAVRKFQEQNSLPTTGFVGPLTKAKLQEKTK